MAAAALWDASPPGGGRGRREDARASRERRPTSSLQSRVVANVAWGALIRAAAKGERERRPLADRDSRSGGFSGVGSSRPALAAATPAGRSPRRRAPARARGRARCDPHRPLGRPRRRRRRRSARRRGDARSRPRRSRTSCRSTRGSSGRSLRGRLGRRARAPRAARAARRVPWGRAPPGRAMLPGPVARARRARRRSGGRAASRVTLDVRGLDLRDGEGRAVDLARSHASLERTPPMRDEGGVDATYDDFDALRVVMAVPDHGPGLDGERDIAVESLERARGAHRRRSRACRSRPSRCAASVRGRALLGERAAAVRHGRRRPQPPARARADRSRPKSAGRIVFRSAGRKAQMIRVLGPRDSPVGPIGRLRATLRPFVLRVTPGGAPAIGGTDAGAVEALRGGARGGVRHLGAVRPDVRRHALARGQARRSAAVAPRRHRRRPRHRGERRRDSAARGRQGDQRADDARARAPIRSRENLARAVGARRARRGRLAQRAHRPGSRAERRRLRAPQGRDARRGRRTAPGAPLSTDPTLSVRIGSVDVSDGLQHFTDVDAMAGTLEERTLLKAIDDGDPATIEVVVVPLFAGGGRIGESFIGSDLSSVRNIVLLDRAGIRARKSSLTLAHELGHVFLDLPGHPDDYGVDTPTLAHGLGRRRRVALRSAAPHARRVRARRAPGRPEGARAAARRVAGRSDPDPRARASAVRPLTCASRACRWSYDAPASWHFPLPKHSLREYIAHLPERAHDARATS